MCEWEKSPSLFFLLFFSSSHDANTLFFQFLSSERERLVKRAQTWFLLSSCRLTKWEMTDEPRTSNNAAKLLRNVEQWDESDAKAHLQVIQVYTIPANFFCRKFSLELLMMMTTTRGFGILAHILLDGGGPAKRLLIIFIGTIAACCMGSSSSAGNIFVSITLLLLCCFSRWNDDRAMFGALRYGNVLSYNDIIFFIRHSSSI